MIGINKTIKNQLALFMLYLLVYISFQPVKKSLYAETPNPEPPQQRSNILFNQPTFKAGDAVKISVYPDTTSFLHNIFPIDGEGAINLPVLGKIVVTKMSKSELEDFIKNNYSQYLRVPNVQVQPLIRASLLGGFNEPGLYFIDKYATMWDLVQLAHGTTMEDGLKKMKWERNRKTIQSNLIPFFESGKSLADIGFKSGDQIWTPSPDRTNFVDRLIQLMPFATAAITGLTLYYTVQLSTRVR